MPRRVGQDGRGLIGQDADAVLGDRALAVGEGRLPAEKVALTNTPSDACRCVVNVRIGKRRRRETRGADLDVGGR